MKNVKIERVIFPGKRPDMEEVEAYLKSTLKTEYVVKETNDKIKIGSKFASEFCGSTYTKRLKGSLLKAKVNSAQIIPALIENAVNRRWTENKEIKHNNDAKLGWYRYDVFFSLPVIFDSRKSVNYYKAAIVTRINDNGIYLHDIVNIKKEDSKPFESEDRTV